MTTGEIHVRKCEIENVVRVLSRSCLMGRSNSGYKIFGSFKSSQSVSEVKRKRLEGRNDPDRVTQEPTLWTRKRFPRSEWKSNESAIPSHSLRLYSPSHCAWNMVWNATMTCCNRSLNMYSAMEAAERTSNYDAKPPRALSS